MLFRSIEDLCRKRLKHGQDTGWKCFDIIFLYLGTSKYVDQDLRAFWEVKGIICLDAV